MTIADSAHDLLAAYSRHAGVAGLQFNQHGCARLLFEDSVAIDLEIDDAQDCIQLYSVLGPVPAGGREALYRALLEGNLFGTQTAGATLAIDGVLEEVVLCHRVASEAADVTELVRLLEALAGTTQLWRQKLGSGDFTAGSTHSADSAGPQSWQGAYLRG